MNEEIQDFLARGTELMAARRYEDAVEVYKSVLALDKANYEAFFNLGNAYTNQQMLDEGIDAFKKALLAKPDSDEARYSLGCAYFIADRLPEAVKEFNCCEEHGFAPLEMYEILETIFVDSDDPIQAIRYANKAIEANPLLPDHYINKAQFYLLLEKPKEAAAVLREVESLLPDAAEPYQVEVQIHLQSGDFGEAVTVCDRALSRFPDDPSMLLVKGQVLNQAEKADKALELLDKAAELVGLDSSLIAEIDAARGVSYALNRDTDASIECLKRAVAAGGQSQDQASFMLLSELAVVEDYEQIEACVKTILELGDISPRTRAAAIFWNAFAAKKLGQDAANELLRDAQVHLRRITIANPGIIEAYCYRLQCHKELGEYDKALDLADHLIRLAPKDAAGYALKSDVLAAKGDVAGAAQFREKALGLDPSFKF